MVNFSSYLKTLCMYSKVLILSSHIVDFSSVQKFCAGGQPFHDITFTAMKCTCSMYMLNVHSGKWPCEPMKASHSRKELPPPLDDPAGTIGYCAQLSRPGSCCHTGRLAF